jgi:leucyl-tRNA synthetase
MRQWMLRITTYAQRLIDDLEGLDWPESIKALQRNWIGRSEGAHVRFKLENEDRNILVFTTRPDTFVRGDIHGFSPGTSTRGRNRYRGSMASRARVSGEDRAQERSRSNRTGQGKDGVFTGAFAINPVNGERIPIWIADYVLPGYGTGRNHGCACAR